MDRRAFLRTVGTALGASTLVPVVGSAAARVRDLEGAARRPPVLPDVFPKVRDILAPLGSVPALVPAGDVLRVELDARRVPSGDGLSLALAPRFGAAREPVALSILDVQRQAASPLWRDREVTVVTVAVPGFQPGRFVEDLYDLVARWPLGSDRQPRAVKVVSAIPEHPRIVVIADPSVADPRPLEEGARAFSDTGRPDPLLDKLFGTFGTPPDARMWHAFNACIDEVNLVQPDFVLVPGDLVFGLYPRPLNYEFEEAHRLLKRCRVPTFLTPGNHDLYHLDYDRYLAGYLGAEMPDRPLLTDGKALWPLYFGPLQWSTDIGDDLHLMSINTFDWPDDRRAPFQVHESGDPQRGTITQAGGYVSDEQLSWVADDLRSWRAAHPDGAIVTFAHHNPSWRGARHPWPGRNRLELRDLLAEVGAGAHFAGHTHDDRIARYVSGGDIVETNGNNGWPRGELHYMTRDDALDPDWSQDELAAMVRDPSHGPVFVDTTTAASGLDGDGVWGLGSYWGWRLATLRYEQGGYDPTHFGYPATREFLDAHATNPENWNEAHAPLGVFSYPVFFVDQEVDGRNDGTEPHVVVRLRSRLLADLDVVVAVSVAAPGADGLSVSGGQLTGVREGDGVVDAWIALTLPAGGMAEVTAQAT